MPLKYKWSISRGECISRENIFITYEDGSLSGLGEVAFKTNEGTTIEDIENEFHALFKCKEYVEIRNNLFERASLIKTNFSNMSDNDKLIFLFSNEKMIR